MQKLLLFFSFFLVCGIFGCKKKTDHQPVPLAGTTWQEIEPDGITFFAGSNYRIHFLDDQNFQLHRRSFTDAIDATDSCFFAELNEYVMGTYQLYGGQLTLSGVHSDTTYATPKPTCRGRLQFSESYPYRFDDGWLILNCNDDVAYQVRMKRE